MPISRLRSGQGTTSGSLNLKREGFRAGVREPPCRNAKRSVISLRSQRMFAAGQWK